MSRGLEEVYRLLKIENSKAIYAYSGDNFSYPFDKELARSGYSIDDSNNYKSIYEYGYVS